jgi:hypothetical protein
MMTNPPRLVEHREPVSLGDAGKRAMVARNDIGM